MSTLLGMEEEILKEKKSWNTAKEITQQPELWKETIEIFKNSKPNLENYLKKIGFDNEFEVIFTGAGTSEYVGNILEPLLRKDSEIRFRSLATTDILTNPLNYLKKNRKTLLVSFARSGDSPESMAVVDIANKNVEEVYHLFITCNKEGALAKSSENNEKVFLLLMPEKSNDKGFAMINSFSCMLLSGILVFGNNSEEITEEMKKIIILAENELKEKYPKIKELADNDNKRIVILGSGILKGLAEELSLKVMELSGGKAVSVSNTTLGFRHGPKAIINEETIVFNLVNQNEYAQKYDEGLLEEMFEDGKSDRLVAYSVTENNKITENTHNTVFPVSISDIKNKELCSLFIYLIYGQMYAFFKSQYLGNTTDNPFPTGEVNRVVKKFKIHKFNN
ncbi:MAG: SIS domain-containing protein [Leptotrichiaceae bacterium]|nr:SIS domain-containing protein [Leptotrichiaceae bacterium]